MHPYRCSKHFTFKRRYGITYNNDEINDVQHETKQDNNLDNDLIMIWTLGLDSLKEVIIYLNTRVDSIKFTSEIS